MLKFTCLIIRTKIKTSILSEYNERKTISRHKIHKMCAHQRHTYRKEFLFYYFHDENCVCIMFCIPYSVVNSQIVNVSFIFIALSIILTWAHSSSPRSHFSIFRISLAVLCLLFTFLI